jgi:8-oxo-dGTP pyrophosphatase MutT (NUDIX family)
MKPGRVRPIAICLIRRSRDGCILVMQGYDPLKGETFYRPLGGTIEFGEYSRETIERELMEEIGAEVADLRYLATIENVFEYNGQTGHEIVLVYEGRLADPSLYEYNAMVGRENDGSPMAVVWQRVDSFTDEAPLYPTGLLELLV